MAKLKCLKAQHREIILAFAECNMSITETAKRVHMVYNAVNYNLEQIKEITGKDPKTFYGLCALVVEANRRVNNG